MGCLWFLPMVQDMCLWCPASPRSASSVRVRTSVFLSESIMAISSEHQLSMSNGDQWHSMSRCCATGVARSSGLLMMMRMMMVMIGQIGSRFSRPSHVPAESCFSHRPAARLPVPMMSSVWGSVPGLLANAGYLVEAVLGEGGFGRAYRVRDSSAALFVVKAIAADDNLEEGEVGTGAYEARVLRQLRHPHVVQIYSDFAMPQCAPRQCCACGGLGRWGGAGSGPTVVDRGFRS